MPLLGIPSFWELVLIFGVVFLLFGGKKLPELGGALGESIKNFKKGLKDEEATKQLANKSQSADQQAAEQPSDKQPPQA